MTENSWVHAWVRLSLLLASGLLWTNGWSPAEPRNREFRESLFLPRSGAQASRKWIWPTLDNFRDRHSQYDRDAWAIRLVKAKIHLIPEASSETESPSFLLASGTPERLQVTGLIGGPVRTLQFGNPWKIQSGDLAQGGRVLLAGKDRVLAELTVFRPAPRAHIMPDLWDLWVYTTGLLESEPPVYDSFEDGRYPGFEEEHPVCEDLDRVRQQQGPVAASFRVRKALVEKSIGRHDNHWYREAKRAREARDTDLALAIYRYFVPVGACSMDEGPSRVARDYSALCYDLGKLSSYLQLRLAILGNQFERLVYSSYGERASRTGAEELEATGLDVDRFLLGLLVQVETRRRQSVDPFRLGRAIVEAGKTGVLEPVLSRWAEDANIDEWNRTLAAVVLTSVLYHDSLEREVPGAWDAVPNKFLEAKGKVAKLTVTALARAWLTQN